MSLSLTSSAPATASNALAVDARSLDALKFQADFDPKYGYVSGSMKAIWDNMRGIDLLQGLPDVDPDPTHTGSIQHQLFPLHRQILQTNMSTEIVRGQSVCQHLRHIHSVHTLMIRRWLLADKPW